MLLFGWNNMFKDKQLPLIVLWLSRNMLPETDQWVTRLSCSCTGQYCRRDIWLSHLAGLVYWSWAFLQRFSNWIKWFALFERGRGQTSMFPEQLCWGLCWRTLSYLGQLTDKKKFKVIIVCKTNFLVDAGNGQRGHAVAALYKVEYNKVLIRWGKTRNPKWFRQSQGRSMTWLFKTRISSRLKSFVGSVGQW